MEKILAVAFALFSFTSTGSRAVSPITTPAKPAEISAYLHVYDDLRLNEYGLNREVFEYALRGMQKVDATRPVLSIADMSQPSTRKRLYVIDLASGKLLFNTYVAHGRNTGELNAMNFSNVASSFQSSLGFYRTLETYSGKHGLSLKLKGLEPDFNSNAYDRAIVIHGADYVCEDVITRTGRLGRSQGCPAVPNAISKTLIQAIKGGTTLFLYYPDQHYLKNSRFLS